MNPIPSQEEIRRGDTTDVYFVRTREVLKSLGKEAVRVKAEVYVKRFPDGYEHAILAGRDEMKQKAEQKLMEKRKSSGQ